jgi:acyl-coenzyme A synthetase/AMP-(fatty) acid ligase
VALVDGAAALTWAELAGRAHRLANHLCRRGVGPETRVAVCMERGAERSSRSLACWRRGRRTSRWTRLPGGAHRYVVGDAGAPLLLTQARLLGRLAELPVRTLCAGRGLAAH